MNLLDNTVASYYIDIPAQKMANIIYKGLILSRCAEQLGPLDLAILSMELAPHPRLIFNGRPPCCGSTALARRTKNPGTLSFELYVHSLTLYSVYFIE